MPYFKGLFQRDGLSVNLPSTCFKCHFKGHGLDFKCHIAGIVGGVDGWNGTEIESIWVDEAYRRQGIGSALIRAFEQAAKENGAGTMVAEPYDWNMEFFRKNGYVTITGALEDYPKGHTMYCTEKSL